MARYEVKEDEAALVVKPIMEDDGSWSGDIATGIYVSPHIETTIQAHLVHIITLMSAFLDWVEEYPDILDEIEDHRNMLMEGYMEEKKKPEITREGNVLRLTRWTKTEGSA